MPMNYGNIVSKHAQNGIAKVGPGTWARLVSSGTSPLPKRQWIEIQVRGGMALALAYTNRNADGTFTSPAHSAQSSKIIPANSIKGEPLGETVMLWGRGVKKAGNTDGGVKVVVTEYA